jgi:hypothetical protein
VAPRQGRRSSEAGATIDFEAITGFLLVLVALASSLRSRPAGTAHAAASSVTKQESGFHAHSTEKMKEFFFYGDSRHTDAPGHDHQAQ